MDIYTENGNIIRQFPNSDSTTQLELEFIFDNLFWSRLFGITIFYIAFRKRLSIDYVILDYSIAQVQLRQQDFNHQAEQVLIQTLIDVKSQANLLLAIANKHLFDKPPGDVVETNKLDILRPYEITKLDCLEFVEQFAIELQRWL